MTVARWRLQLIADMKIGPAVRRRAASEEANVQQLRSRF